MVTAWVQDTGMHLYPNTDIGGKYTILSNGELYINNAGPSDAFKTYTCRTVNRLTGNFFNQLIYFIVAISMCCCKFTFVNNLCTIVHFENCYKKNIETLCKKDNKYLYNY